MGEWTLFSNHGHVLVCLANNNEARLRDVAAEVGITERAVQNILREMQDSGLVEVSKHGRCNHYQINQRKSLRHPLEAHCTVGKLLQLLKSDDAGIKATDTTVRPAAKPPRQTIKAEPATVKLPKPDPVKVAASVTKQKPVESQPMATQPVVVKPAVSKPVETKPVETKSADAETTDPKSTEIKPASSKKAKDSKAKDKNGEPPSSQQGSLF